VNVDVLAANGCAFDMSGATVNLYLEGVNTLQSGKGCAGLQCPEGGTLVIWDGPASSTGSLSATGGNSLTENNNGAGIGGGFDQNGGNITVQSGIIEAIGCYHSAGIGGGLAGSNGGAGGTVTINGGTVTARGGMHNGKAIGVGPGIGGTGGGSVTITGGTVNAYGGGCGGAGIGGRGGGFGYNGGSVTISGGVVTAIGSDSLYGAGAGIGGGGADMDRGGDGGIVNISGGTVVASGGNSSSCGGAAGIGSGSGWHGPSSAGTLYISGGSVKISDGSGLEALPAVPKHNASDNIPVFLNKATLDGAQKIKVNSLTANAGYTYGITDMFTDDSGTIYLYLPDTTTATQVQTSEKIYDYVSGAFTADTTKPCVKAMVPFTGSMSNCEVVITFNEEMRTSAGTVSLSSTNGTITPDASAGSWSDENTIYTIPYSGLSYSTTYTVIISAFSDYSENVMVDSSAYTFTTPPNNNATLSNLSLSTGTLSPAFLSGVCAYSAMVSNSVTGLTVTPTANDTTATVTVNGTAVANGAVSNPINLSIGENTVTVEVTAQDGTTTQTYTVTVTRAQAVSSGGSSTVYYTITASASAGGIISPSGSASAKYGSNKTYTITADAGYEIENVLVDGLSVGKVLSYTFDNVKKTHSIAASFKKKAVEPVNPFNDVAANDWFYKNVMFVFENGLMTGIASDTFSPNGTTTRAMFVTVLFRLSGDKDGNTNSFSDVPSGAWYENSAAWAAANGIAGGVGGNQFAPISSLTREQLAVMLYNYAKYKGLDVSVGKDTNILSYNDSTDISEYAYSALQWACGSGIIKGDGSGNLNPQSSATRAEVAAMLEKFITYNESD